MKIKKSTVYTLWSLAILVCIIASIFALIFASCSKTENDAPAEVTPSAALPVEDDAPGDVAAEPDLGQTPEQSAAPEASPTRLAETADAGIEYQDRFVFLGDSTTYGLKYYGVLSGGENTTQVWTPSSGTLTLSNQSIATIVYPETGEEITIADAASRRKPEYLLITLGVNGVSFMDEEYFTSEYTDLVKSIQQASPDTKIILNSIYPVASNYEYLSSINNELITRANGWIERIAENTGVRFLNTYEAIVGADGWLPQQYQTDGLHLNPDGFGVILNYLRTHEYK